MTITANKYPGLTREIRTRGRHAQDPQLSRGTSRQWAGWLLVAYLVPLSALVFSVRLSGTGLPQLADSLVLWSKETGILTGMRFDHVEAVANVAVFAPIGFLLAGVWGRRAGSRSAHPVGLPDWAVWLFAAAGSAGIELTQLFLLTERNGTMRDLLCNSAGALTGIVVYRIIQLVQQRARTRRSP